MWQMSEVAVLKNVPKLISHRNILVLTRHFDKNSKVTNYEEHTCKSRQVLMIYLEEIQKNC